ncbi:hypothetical protein QQF64_008694 [Cirrhinus molitorella]|uniref:Uncharacterized protein n=1 Tax=Cirrhinus molitorella TaxID=172907 RepID=A0ABR3M6Y3_9TELE
MPMSASCASLTGRPSTSRAPPRYAEAPQTLCICSVWPRQSVQFSTICWACTYAPQKGHRQLCLTRKNSNDTVRNHHDCCHHQHHLMRPDPLNVCAKPAMEMAFRQSGGGGACVRLCVWGAYVCASIRACTCVNVRGDTGVGGKEGGVACSNGSLKEINGLQMAQSIYSNETCKVAGQPSEIRLGLAERRTAKETRDCLSL